MKKKHKFKIGDKVIVDISDNSFYTDLLADLRSALDDGEITRKAEDTFFAALVNRQPFTVRRRVLEEYDLGIGKSCLPFAIDGDYLSLASEKKTVPVVEPRPQVYLMVALTSTALIPTFKVVDGMTAKSLESACEAFRKSRQYKPQIPPMCVVTENNYRRVIREAWEQWHQL